MINDLLAECMLAFNIWDINSAKAIIDAAAAKKRNVILQTSAGVYNQMDAEEVRAFIKSYADKKSINVWLHLDHCKDMKILEDAIVKKWDSVMIDASDSDIEENIKKTNIVIEKAHREGILVEAEVGQIKGTEDDLTVDEYHVTDRDEIKKFLRETKVDMFAAAFGTVHGMYKGKPDLDYSLIDYVANISDVPFVVHGSSGLEDKEVRKLTKKENVKKINISTEVKLAYRKGILESIEGGLLEENGFQAIYVEKKIYEAIYYMAYNKFSIIG
ncbi:class II fructose-bisphosphate aldolase [Kineothrix sp. MB12-C1]|uniref:class II fructose-bisphosphate aldolase n=1 Tax=Kineothrix sp. MB12-C1 TaxID=3070215 RepID=UPI0027D34607|nr:class II fructose-bisphosphate aldolase [Kineothrix sp. MB12-C1]WMC93873.1 class II fructose-bisphosphate aldolase [Kineothrix sp. MB12-C1]